MVGILLIKAQNVTYNYFEYEFFEMKKKKSFFLDTVEIEVLS